MRGNDDREIASLGSSYGFPTSPWQQGDDRPEPLVDHQHADEQQDGGTHQAEDSSHLMSPSSNTETDVVKPVMIRLTLPRTGVPTPCRAELEHVEWMAIRHVVVTALQDAVQPPLVRTRLDIAVPLNPVPLAKRDGSGADVRSTPPKIAWIFRQHVETPIG